MEKIVITREPPGEDEIEGREEKSEEKYDKVFLGEVAQTPPPPPPRNNLLAQTFPLLTQYAITEWLGI